MTETCTISATQPAPPLEIAVSEKLASGLSTSLIEANVWRTQTFTPKLRWGNDYMHARYYSPTLARFVSVDPVGGGIGSSQSWNRYAYVLNNPIGLVDPDGRAVVSTQGIGMMQQKYSDFYWELLDVPVAGVVLAGTFDTLINVFPSNDEVVMGLVPGPAVTIANASRNAARLGFKLKNIFRNNLKSETVRGAAIESQGGVTKLRPDGKPFDHVSKFLEGRDGARNAIDKLKAALSSDKLTGQQRDFIEDLLSDYSKRLDKAEELFFTTVKRIEKEKAK